MVIVTARLHRDVALALQKKKPSSSESKELLQLAKELKIELKPMHPGSNDPLLMPWYMIEVKDKTRVDHVITRIQSCKGVEAAYVKPPNELP